MAYQIKAGIQVSLGLTSLGAATTDPALMIWYPLTDHNRQPIKIGYEVIEKTNRMADGTLRRYVIARKHKLSTSWQNLPSKSIETVDKFKSGAWMQSFYRSNVFVPVYVKLINAQITTDPANGTAPNEDTYYASSFDVGNDKVPDIYLTYITNFDYEVFKRNVKYDLVNINIEFTEV
jgi:hypothetical protein